MDLVTGATGIVGAHVLLECAHQGAVRAIHRDRSDRSIVERIFRFYRADGEALLQRIEWREAGLEDTDALNEAMRDIRHVYHAAAVVSFDPKDTGSMERVNVAGTANVVNAALANGVERLCHVSSTATIGEAPVGVFRDETLPWVADRRRSVYAMSKYAAELEVHRGIAEGLDAVMVNPCIVLGPGLPGRSSMTLVERLRKGSLFYPPGSNAVVDARDVARCMISLMDRGTTGERYLLVGENLSYQRLFSMLSEAFGRTPPGWPLRPWMLEVGWRLERARSMLTGSTPFITEATAHSAVTRRGYDATKVRDLLGHRFRSAGEATANVAAFLRQAGST